MASAKPTIALDLSNEAISVWHWRGASGWTSIGQVAPTDPDLSAKLAEMRRAAGGNAGARLATAVRIPRSEVMVSRISLSVFEGDAARAQARKMIADMTPYDLDDLVYDLGPKGAGNQAPVAIVARHTLTEAENFARQNGFEPVYFTTHFRKEEFSREPRFTVPQQSRVGAVPWPRLAAAAAVACVVLGLGYMGVDALTANRPSANTGPELTTAATAPAARETADALASAPAQDPLPPVTEGASPVALTELASLLHPPGETVDQAVALQQQGRIKPHGYQRLARVDPSHGDFAIALRPEAEDVKSDALIIAEALRDLPEVDLNEATTDALQKAFRLQAPDLISTQSAPIILAALTNPAVELSRPAPLQPLFRRDYEPGSEASRTAPPPPPPPGLSAAPGDVIPTTEGTIGPQGILVFAGRPPVESRRRPQIEPPPDPLLAFRPKARPDDLVSAEQLALITSSATSSDATDDEEPQDQTAETIGEAVLAAINPETETTPGTETESPDTEIAPGILSRADPGLAPFRPKARPASVQEKAAEAQAAARQAEDDLAPNAFAVAVSPKPQRRPDKIAALAAAKAQQEADTKVTASTPKQAIGTARPAPGPTANAVARNATERSNFSKSRMSLVGVFGTPSDRRALVRLASGRYVKVQTGDRVSGWQVSAIGESTLRINRGSRDQVLRMP